MRAVVVYESMYGNTRAIAVAVAEGLTQAIGSRGVETYEVATAPTTLADDIGLLVVGGPTHAHGMSTAKSRADAATRAGERLVSRGDGIREWLAALPPTPAGMAAAAFDTRIKGPGLLWGSAAKGADKQLRALGARMVTRPESFLVGGPTGPVFDRLVAGELDRARAWGQQVAAAVAGPSS